MIDRGELSIAADQYDTPAGANISFRSSNDKDAGVVNFEWLQR
jgi:hypothetical protein